MGFWNKIFRARESQSGAPAKAQSPSRVAASVTSPPGAHQSSPATTTTNPNVRDQYGRTPLMLAALTGNSRELAHLISTGAELDSQDIMEDTALILAASKCNADCVKALIAAGANVHLKTSTGESALSWAIVMDDTESVQALVAAGANEGLEVDADGQVVARDVNGNIASTTGASAKVRAILGVSASSSAHAPSRSAAVQEPVTVCVTFDTNKAGSSYGREAWFTFWKTIREKELGVGTNLYCGDLLGVDPNMYGILVESTDLEVVQEIKSRFSAAEDYQKICGRRQFIEGLSVPGAHLINAGRIDSRYVLVGGESDWARVELSSVKLPELSRIYMKDSATPVAPRPVPASSRTAGIASLTEMSGLKEVLKSRFPTERDASSLRPEEVCDLADACSARFYVAWELSGTVYTESFVKVYFMERGGNQSACQLQGFFNFPSAGDIDRLIKESIGESKRSLLNITGITALNLIGPKDVNFNERGKAWMVKESLSGDQLWKYVHLRKVQLGLA